MPTTAQLRKRLMGKLKELFQLDQPDLDFGFYRIMHAKAEQVERFIETDLLQIVAAAFRQVDETRTRELQTAYEAAVREARDEYGAPEPEKTPKALRAKAVLDAARDTASVESEIYDHLYRFFERYYDNGDFISRRYYARETAGKAAPFAIPYNGEEVKLHWANADQYYIKTAEYFANFTFDLRKAPQTATETAPQTATQTPSLFADAAEQPPRRVHFRVVQATEGEHGNVKASEATRRFFLIHAAQPVTVNEHGELVVNFEYRPDPEKSGQENTWRDKRNGEAATTILAALTTLAQGDAVLTEYLQLLQTPAPTDSDKKRVLLAKYIHQYTARNTMDYFIHKDLGGFLRRELDFYIKNEVMRLDDIEDADAPAVESYLAKIKVLRRIAGKLIDFLAQLEEFQKKLWLKKKFVVETNYCITLDRVPEELYPAVAANETQREEWVKLFAIDEIAESTISPGYSAPLSVAFLKANDKLVLDTRFFDESFKARLLAAIENCDEQCDGLLIHSENFQALNLLQERYREQVKCVHIDPPYNTRTSGFLYKNAYQHSSWLAMMGNRIGATSSLITNDGAYVCHIDENEYERLHMLLDAMSLPNAGTIIWDKRNPMNSAMGIATQHEYIVWRSWNQLPVNRRNDNIVAILEKAANLVGKYGKDAQEAQREFSAWISANKMLGGGEKAYRYLDDEGYVYQSVSLRAPEPRSDPKFFEPLIHPRTNKPCPVPPNGFSRTPETLAAMMNRGEILFGDDESTQPRQKVLLKNDTSRQMASLIKDGRKGKADMVLLGLDFPYCHPVSLYEEIVAASAPEKKGIVFDYFAGSGTSGHAVINLNREDGGSRKYILVEMGDYFDTVLKPRIAKVVYSESWKEGKPTARDTGISHCCKYLRLESYEDALNNLTFAEDAARRQVLAANPALRAEYMLHYLLDVETHGSQSLLNIAAFADPTAYTLTVKQPGADAYATAPVDLMESFNYLIGLRVVHIAAPQSFSARFTRTPDPALPTDRHTRLAVDGRIHQDAAGVWWFRKIEGWLPRDPANPNNGQRDKVLIVWRKLTGDLEQDNLMLDEWFRKNRISTRDFEYDIIYVNGSNNLPNLLQEGETWKVRLIEEEFLRRMWDVEGI